MLTEAADLADGVPAAMARSALAVPEPGERHYQTGHRPKRRAAALDSARGARRGLVRDRHRDRPRWMRFSAKLVGISMAVAPGRGVLRARSRHDRRGRGRTRFRQPASGPRTDPAGPARWNALRADAGPTQASLKIVPQHQIRPFQVLERITVHPHARTRSTDTMLIWPSCCSRAAHGYGHGRAVAEKYLDHTSPSNTTRSRGGQRQKPQRRLPRVDAR